MSAPLQAPCQGVLWERERVRGTGRYGDLETAGRRTLQCGEVERASQSMFMDQIHKPLMAQC